MKMYQIKAQSYLKAHYCTQCAPAISNLDQKVQSETTFSRYSDVKQVNISQNNYLSTGFPPRLLFYYAFEPLYLSQNYYKCIVKNLSWREACWQMFFFADLDFFHIIVTKKGSFSFGLFGLG